MTGATYAVLATALGLLYLAYTIRFVQASCAHGLRSAAAPFFPRPAQGQRQSTCPC